MTDPSLGNKGTRQAAEDIERAVRVLTALTENRFPDPDDVAELRRLVPEAAGKTIEEIVCDVIQNAVKERSAVNGKVPPA